MRKLVVLFLVASVFLLGGCTEVGVYQKINRDGTFDMDLVLRSDSSVVLDSLKRGLEVDSGVADRYSYEESDKSVFYRFKGIDPKIDVLFKKKEQSYSPLSTLQGMSYELKKEFRFPYYYYTYEIVTFKEERHFSDDWRLEPPKVGGRLVEIGHTVDVFGGVVETNGRQVGSSRVKFDVEFNKDERYYVKFRDFFVSSWVGDAVLFGRYSLLVFFVVFWFF